MVVVVAVHGGVHGFVVVVVVAVVAVVAVDGGFVDVHGFVVVAVCFAFLH